MARCGSQGGTGPVRRSEPPCKDTRPVRLAWPRPLRPAPGPSTARESVGGRHHAFSRAGGSPAVLLHTTLVRTCGRPAEPVATSRKAAASYSSTLAVRSAKMNPTNRNVTEKHRFFSIPLANAHSGARVRCAESVSDAEKTPTDPATRDHLVSATMGFPWDTITASATARMPEFAQSPGSIDFREGIDPF